MSNPLDEMFHKIIDLMGTQQEQIGLLATATDILARRIELIEKELAWNAKENE